MSNVFDLAGSVSRGVQLGNNMSQIRRQNALADMYQQHGVGIMNADPAALAQMAQYDPMAAQQIITRQREMERQDAADARAVQSHNMSMQVSKAQLDEIERNAEQQARQAAAQMDAATREREARDLGNALAQGVAAFTQGDQALASWIGMYSQQLQEAGIDPNGVNMQNAPAILKAIKGIQSGLMGGDVPLPGVQSQSGFRVATPQEAAPYGAKAGQFGPDGRFYPINPPRGSEIVVGADGSVRVLEGAGVGGGEPSVGDVYDPGEVQSTVRLIDQIAGTMQGENLEHIFGPIEGGGGNNSDEFGATRRAYYGEEGLAAIDMINQLQSRAWLAARAMLKGGGAITDFESNKAEAAVVRLKRPQGKENFLAALQELRDAITEGLRKLEAHKNGNPQQVSGAADLSNMTDEQLEEYEKRLLGQ